jgi:hypothetical protein
MPDPMPGPLGGEADPNAWVFSANHGPLPNPVGHTFPLLTHDADGQWRLIGTGFYVSGDGLFVTAKHVIEDVLRGNQQISPLVILHLRSESGLFGAQEYLLRPITQCWLGDSADIALGAAARATNNVTGEVLTHWSWPLCWAVPFVGGNAATYAFPIHAIKQTDHGQTIAFRPDLYPGTIQQVGDFRDLRVMPFPYMQVDFRIHGAASGGPIVGPDGAVTGVNCTEYAPDGPGFGTQIRCLQDAFLNNGLLCGEAQPGQVTFAELVYAGIITARHYVPNAIPPLLGHLVQLNLPITARGPIVELGMAL